MTTDLLNVRGASTPNQQMKLKTIKARALVVTHKLQPSAVCLISSIRTTTVCFAAPCREQTNTHPQQRHYGQGEYSYRHPLQPNGSYHQSTRSQHSTQNRQGTAKSTERERTEYGPAGKPSPSLGFSTFIHGGLDPDIAATVGSVLLKPDFKSRHIVQMNTLLIGDLSLRTGAPASAIRYYERAGVLPKPTRVNGRRHYDLDAVTRVNVLRFAQQAGFSLKDIRTLFGGFSPKVTLGSRWRSLAVRKLQELDTMSQRIANMRRAIELAAQCGCIRIEDCNLGAMDTAKTGTAGTPQGCTRSC
jgi:MerR family redox-sensitive transcriptional activator SoxR